MTRLNNELWIGSLALDRWIPCIGLAVRTVAPKLAAGSWSATGRMASLRCDRTATLLSSGKVLVADGTTSSGVSLSSAELFTP